MRHAARFLFHFAILMTSAIFLSAVGMAQAQNDEDTAATARNSSGTVEAGLLVGNLLPSGITGVTQMMGLGGVHLGARLSPNGWLEGNLLLGNGSGQSWRNVDTNLRMDIPVENLVGVAFIGLDGVEYSGINKGGTFSPGVHAGCGLQALLGGGVWFRADMKYEIGPGDSLYIGMGIILRFGESGGQGQN